jgi:hypothetical protein
MIRAASANCEGSLLEWYIHNENIRQYRELR